MVVRYRRRARIARGTVESGDGRVAAQGADERMLAATRSKDEYSHATRAYRHELRRPSHRSRVNLANGDSVLNVGW